MRTWLSPTLQLHTETSFGLNGLHPGPGVGLIFTKQILKLFLSFSARYLHGFSGMDGSGILSVQLMKHTVK